MGASFEPKLIFSYIDNCNFRTKQKLREKIVLAFKSSTVINSTAVIMFGRLISGAGQGKQSISFSCDLK